VAQLDLLVVGALASDRAVAQYAAPFRLALLVSMPLIAVNQVIPPLLAGWHARGQLRRTERVMRGTAGMALIVAAVLALGFLVIGKEILDELFGHEYRDAYSILMILVAGQVLQTVTGSCGFALMMTGHSRWYAKILGVSTVATLGVQVLGYELWGLDGVALATAASLVLQNIVQAVAVKRLAGFSVWADPWAAIREARRALRRSGTG
jgi:O-antigen/teichoic acid export membrane protein